MSGPPASEPAGLRRVRARVEGTVQGVGFRPHVHRLVAELGLAGFVRNDERGVELEVEGDGASVERFFARLLSDAPPLARIERVVPEEARPTGERGFRIVESASTGAPAALVSPDAATCDACLAELFDPANRRHRYPFINCTDCGPRFTIVRGVPYDRPLTTMAGFEMCDACRAEYQDPRDRRFHAQPNACPRCGPTVRLTDREGNTVQPGGDPVAAAAAALAAGRIVAVKGLGGFHLACLARDEAAVAALRGRKHREDKPFALMVPDLAAARELASVSAEDEELLASPARPIVLAPRRQDVERAPDVAASVAPGARDLGLLLPYTPLHHLLLAAVGTPIVLTSGNVSDEPIAYRDEDALARLGGIADLFLLHDRPIHVRTDDSVARTVALGGGDSSDPPRRPLLLRRSRGYVPAALTLPLPCPRPVLACGAELKSTFCLAKGERAWVSHHVGDLRNLETLLAFRSGVAHFEELFAVRPEVVAHDLHPDYLSTGEARARAERDPEVELLAVQHHHAHLAAVLAEHGEEGPAVGVIFDGTGHGDDGAVWGGELLVGGLAGYERAGHLWPVRLPGGDQAVRQPWRMACAWLAAARGGKPPAEPPPALAGRVGAERWRAVAGLVEKGFSAPWTTSIGRLFDAVSALCGLRAEARYEGQAAIELEAASEGEAEGEAYPLPVVEGAVAGGATEPVLLLDARPTVRAVVEDLADGVPVPAIGGRFHRALARAAAEAAAELCRRRGVETVVLSGGVFQNRLLLEATAAILGSLGAKAGLRVLVPERLPPNDGAIAYGQAAIAAAKLAHRWSSAPGS